MNKLIIGILFACCIGLFGFSYYTNSKVNKVVVVDVLKLVNEFDLKKELETTVEGKLQFYTGKLDSLKVVFENAKSSSIRGSAQQLYQKIEQDYQYAMETSNTNINEQVWKRLNPLIQEYGEENAYRVIVGANGMGSVLYRDDATDCTKDLIHYVNKKFKTGG